MGTKVEWCDETVNPIIGCSKISEACKNCVAEKFAKRGMCEQHRQAKAWDGTIVWAGGQLEKIAKWKKPRKIFLGIMTDLFHENVPLEWLGKVMDAIVANPKHTFMILTKRPERMRWFFSEVRGFTGADMPDNLWLGVTVEHQGRAMERLPILLDIPAKIKFVSCEPMLGEMDFMDYFYPPQGTSISDANPQTLEWVICGAETGTGKRGMSTAWATTMMKHCDRACVPFFFKKDSDGNHQLNGKTYEQFPVT